VHAGWINRSETKVLLLTLLVVNPSTTSLVELVGDVKGSLHWMVLRSHLKDLEP